MLPVPNDHAIYRRLDSGAVIYQCADEVYYGLNDVGAAVWELLARPCDSLDDRVARVAEQYPEAGLRRLRQDVAELVESLARYGLLRAPAGAVA